MIRTKDMILFLLGLCLVLYMLLCSNPNPKQVKPIIPSVEQQTESANKIDSAMKAKLDSLWKVNDSLRRNADEANLLYKNASLKYNVLSGKMIGYLNGSLSSFTGDIDSLKKLYLDIYSVTGERDSLCRTEVEQLRQLVSGAEKEITVWDSSYKKLRALLDSSIAYQGVLNDYINETERKNKPKNQMYVGATIYGGVGVGSGVGANVGMLSKRGYMYEGGAAIIGDKPLYSIGVKKIIKLKRNGR